MLNQRELIVRYGTAEPPPTPQRLVAGALSVDVVNGGARGLCWQGVEVIRAIDSPIRAANWATFPPEAAEETLATNTSGFEFERRYHIADSALSCRLRYKGGAHGFFSAQVELTANREFSTNRAGFTLLHPLAGLAGSEVIVLHADGSTESSQFPQLISPQQPVLNIAGLTYRVLGINVSIAFKGEIFEMEDQRNWSDASYKTYCRPLSLPRPYVLAKGETVSQEVEVHLSGNCVSGARETGRVDNVLQLAATAEKMPAVGLALDGKSLPNAEEARIAAHAAPRILQLRLLPQDTEQTLVAAKQLMNVQTELEIEIVIPGNSPMDRHLEELAEKVRNASIRPARVMALPEAYLHSYQPAGPWPEGPTPRDAALAARRWFPAAKIGSGMLTNFTEFNRCRPDLQICDYVTHSTTAVIHAGDDRSVFESLEGLSHVFASARSLAGSREYRLGLISIGMRFNAYGPDVLANPDQVRLAMAGVDPRQRGLFGAAWAVGALAATAGQNVASMALASPVGALGIIYRRAEWTQPIYDDGPRLPVYPLFHVVRALSQIAGAERVSLDCLPNGVVGAAAKTNRGIAVLLANTNIETRTVRLPNGGSVRRLDENTFDQAIADPDWLQNSPAESCSVINLRPISVAFVDLADADVLS